MMQGIYLIHAQATVPMATGTPKANCDWANDLLPGLDKIVGSVMGVALSVGQLMFLAALALLIVLFATKHGSFLVKVLVGVVAFGLLVNSGWLPVASPC